jgi:hypothetical protein
MMTIRMQWRIRVRYFQKLDREMVMLVTKYEPDRHNHSVEPSMQCVRTIQWSNVFLADSHPQIFWESPRCIITQFISENEKNFSSFHFIHLINSCHLMSSLLSEHVETCSDISHPFGKRTEWDPDFRFPICGKGVTWSLISGQACPVSGGWEIHNSKLSYLVIPSWSLWRDYHLNSTCLALRTFSMYIFSLSSCLSHFGALSLVFSFNFGIWLNSSHFIWDIALKSSSKVW